MTDTFVKPDFRSGQLELRFQDGIVCMYGTTTGLKKLAELCMWLVDEPNQGHVHLEDHGILTDESTMGAIAIFDTPEEV